MFDSNLQMPYTQSYTIGWQRKLGRDTAFELRYVGSRHRQDWETVNINEINITDERVRRRVPEGAGQPAGEHRRRPRHHVRVHRRSGHVAAADIRWRSSSGVPAAQAGDPTKYTSTQWTNSTNLGFLAAMNPNPFGFASTNTTTGFIGNSTFRNNAVAAGIPANYFVANPDVIGPTTGTGAFSGANLTTNVGGTHANSVQMELRKRLSKGFQFQRQLHLGERVGAAAIRLPEAVEDIVADRTDRQRAARREGELALRTAVRQGPALGWQRHAA